VWDAINQRHTLSAPAAQKFGGLARADDIFYHAWMAALFDQTSRRESGSLDQRALRPATTVPMRARQWVDRSQPPIGSLATMIAAHSGDPSIVISPRHAARQPRLVEPPAIQWRRPDGRHVAGRWHWPIAAQAVRATNPRWTPRSTMRRTWIAPAAC
jgi:hypothetical protein